MKKVAEPKSQSERFKEAARELGADESQERFDAALRQIAKHKPPPDESKAPRPKKDKPAK